MTKAGDKEMVRFILRIAPFFARGEKEKTRNIAGYAMSGSANLREGAQTSREAAPLQSAAPHSFLASLLRCANARKECGSTL